MRTQVNTYASRQDDARGVNVMRFRSIPIITQANSDGSQQDDASWGNAMRILVDTDKLCHDTNASRRVKAKKVDRSMPLRAGCLMLF